MNYRILEIPTDGERFYPITELINGAIKSYIKENCPGADSGMLHILCTHTSCALTISENYDQSAQADMESFLRHLAPENLPFITHTSEGADDSPSHMKSILMQQNLSLVVDEGKVLLGKWQGLFLCEFRHSPRMRNLIMKYRPD